MPKEKVDLEMELDNEPSVEYVFEDEVTTDEAEGEGQEEVKDEGVTPDENVVTLSKEDYAKLLQPKASEPNEALIEALKALKPEQKKEAEATLNYEAFNKEYFINPSKSTERIIDGKVSKVDQKLAAIERQNALLNQKLALIANDQTRDVYTKYSGEVDGLVNDKNFTYEDALMMVKARHLEEFTQAAVETALAKAAEASKPKQDLPFTNSNLHSTAKGGKTKEVLTLADKQVLNQLVRQSAGAMTLENDMEFLVSYAKKNGLIK